MRVLILLAFAAPLFSHAAEWRFPCPENGIASYTAYRISEPIQVDGRLDEKAWQQAPRSPRFVDIITGRPAVHDTRASVLWDETNLYVAFRVEESFVHAKFTTNNSPIYYDNDVEVFIAGRDAYYEFEINGHNTTLRRSSSGTPPTSGRGFRNCRNLRARTWFLSMALVSPRTRAAGVWEISTGIFPASRRPC